MYKVKNIKQGIYEAHANLPKEILLYQSEDETSIADYAFNQLMYKRNQLFKGALDVTRQAYRIVIETPEGKYMKQQEINTFIEQYYPDAVNKLKKRENFQYNFLGKKLIDFKILFSWHMLYIIMIQKEQSRIDLLTRLTNQTQKQETVMPPIEKNNQHIEVANICKVILEM